MPSILSHLITHILTLSHTLSLSLSHVLPCLSPCFSVSLTLSFSVSLFPYLPLYLCLSPEGQPNLLFTKVDNCYKIKFMCNIVHCSMERLFRSRSRIRSGFNWVSGSGYRWGIRIQTGQNFRPKMSSKNGKN